MMTQGRHPSGRSDIRLGFSGLHQAYEGLHVNLWAQSLTCKPKGHA